jgi:histone H3/H4
MLIQKAPFQRLVREFIKKKGDIRVTLSALMAMQESSEAYLAEYFHDVHLATMKTYFSIHVPQKTLTWHMRSRRETGI